MLNIGNKKRLDIIIGEKTASQTTVFAFKVAHFRRRRRRRRRRGWHATQP